MTISGTRALAMESIAEVDPVLWEAMQGERRRQHEDRKSTRLNSSHQ